MTGLMGRALLAMLSTGAVAKNFRSCVAVVAVSVGTLLAPGLAYASGQPGRGVQEFADAQVGARQLSVNIANGNVLSSGTDVDVTDSGSPALDLQRVYNSTVGAERAVGVGGQLNAGSDIRLSVVDATHVDYVDATGFTVSFAQQLDGSWQPSDETDDGASLSSTSGGYLVVDAGVTRAFDGSGRLTQSTGDDGTAITYAYTSAGGQTRLGWIEGPSGTRTFFSTTARGG